MRKANAELSRLADFESQPDPFAPKPVIGEDPRSMAEIAKAKREEAEKRIEEQKQVPERESVEQRKARLLAQRDALREAKKRERQQELSDFNAKTTT